MKKKVCLFFDRSYIDAHYCFREMANQFLENGWAVDLYMSFGVSHGVPYFDSGKIHIFFIDHSRWELLKLFTKIIREKYGVIVATPQWALYWAVRSSFFSRTPVVCLSDEVYTWDPKTWSAAQKKISTPLKWKKREAWAHRRCLLTVALGEKRFELVQKENRLPKDHPYVIVPNAPAGRGQKLLSAYYRETLSIPASSPILLHSGGMEWSFIPPLMQTARQWGEEFSIVIQTRIKAGADSFAAAPNVKFSQALLPADLMRYATSSPDIGLMLYDRDYPAEARNGNTAGKLGLYLSCGLPVICCNLADLRWVEAETCGVWVPRVEDIPGAARKIMANYGNYSRNALRVFEEKFEYSKHFKVFFEKLNELVP